PQARISAVGGMEVHAAVSVPAPFQPGKAGATLPEALGEDVLVLSPERPRGGVADVEPPHREFTPDLLPVDRIEVLTSNDRQHLQRAAGAQNVALLGDEAVEAGEHPVLGLVDDPRLG